MIYKWQGYKWWIICIIITLVVFSILYYVHPNECPEDARYILSAISQGLAAILALVFTITLVVAQMTRRYTAMDKIIFRPETLFLMIVFGIGIIAPLLVLEFGFWEWGVILSIVIASFCVFSLIPFLKGINDVLKYDIGIANLNEEIMEAIELRYKPKAINKIRELNEIGESAVREYREDVISSISRVLSRIGISSAKEKFGDMTLQVVHVLKNIGVNSVEKGFKVNLAIGGLRMIADETITAGYLFSWDNVPGSESERLRRFLIDDYNFDLAKNAKILKSDDDMTLSISNGEYSVEITIEEEKEKATLKNTDGGTLDLKVKKENGKRKIYNDRGDFRGVVIVNVINTLGEIGVKSAEKGLKNIMADAAEHLTHVGQESGNNKAVVWLGRMGAAVTKYMPEDGDNVIRSIEELKETISED